MKKVYLNLKLLTLLVSFMGISNMLHGIEASRKFQKNQILFIGRDISQHVNKNYSYILKVNPDHKSYLQVLETLRKVVSLFDSNCLFEAHIIENGYMFSLLTVNLRREIEHDFFMAEGVYKLGRIVIKSIDSRSLSPDEITYLNVQLDMINSFLGS